MRDLDVTCGDPAMGEGCDSGRWLGFCDLPRCEGMCEYQGPCLCEGCDSPECCAVWARIGRWADWLGDFLTDQRTGASVRRTIVEGPPVP